MPQLNPAPWLMICVLTWITLILMLTKVLNNNSHLSAPQYNKQPHSYHWIWPWL